MSKQDDSFACSNSLSISFLCHVIDVLTNSIRQNWCLLQQWEYILQQNLQTLSEEVNRQVAHATEEKTASIMHSRINSMIMILRAIKTCIWRIIRYPVTKQFSNTFNSKYNVFTDCFCSFNVPSESRTNVNKSTIEVTPLFRYLLMISLSPFR